ncbi:dephospho-CoA kinase [Hesseltinella vesiculosa]|uniref:Dephospho-CoA kinase n=1 Tax=Hesseltinella vesiculosa TaxID=101127 RepID=A0A1X2GL55_9FUNG|nr:dephospho-CoA kinase [Hesseltinella vesiculosa]
MKLVGLTGGIASGKSTVSRLLQEENVPIIDADKIARDIVAPGRRANKLIRHHFGDEVFLPDGHLDRPKLGQIVFGDEAKRKVLNSCTHPYVRLEMVKQVFYYWLTGYRVVVLDVPLLFESKLDRFVGTTVVVYCSEVLQLQRMMKRDGFDERTATQRLRAQKPLSEKVELADIVIDNSSDLSQLKIQVRQLVQKITPGPVVWLVEYMGPPFLLAAAAYTARYLYLHRS